MQHTAELKREDDLKLAVRCSCGSSVELTVSDFNFDRVTRWRHRGGCVATKRQLRRLRVSA